MRIVIASLVLMGSMSSVAMGVDWKPADNPIMTPWAEKVDPNKPLPEYPRPQMVRPNWVNLNGLWDYAIVDREAARPSRFDGKILVPFPVESALSGVKKPLLPAQKLWYRRSFTAPDLAGGKRLLLHFGAVDWEATVWVNGKELGVHRGGYDAFSYDITDAIKAGDNELVLAVWDPTGTNGAPKGKQNLGSMQNPGGIMYTPCSGIWQTVWLEPVPATHIRSLKIVPDVDSKSVSITVDATGTNAGDAVTVTVMEPRAANAIAKGTGRPGEKIQISIASPKLWTPDAPFLYDLRIALGRNDAGIDAVDSYFGMRKIALGKDDKGITRPMLNGKFVFQSGPLDQGFWPDGIYTAPTDEALKYDIEITKKLGFNCARKHVKVEPDRWYYWCDKLGLLVWQDMPSGGGGKSRGRNSSEDGIPASKERADQFEGELKTMVTQFGNHPSIIMWVVFNEGWGQYDTMRLTNWVEGLDPTRLVNNASGWTDRKCGDVIDMHNYPGPGSPNPEEKRAAVLGEFGGLGLPIDGHKWVEKAWGYQAMNSNAQLTKRYIGLWRGVHDLKESKGLSAAIYTQTTDVETESNGLLTYDRKVIKVDLEKTAAAVAKAEFPPMPTFKDVVPTSEQTPAQWQYTTQKPADGWFKPDFDASSWKQGEAGFGTRSTPGSAVRTVWNTPDIWIRREVTLPANELEKLALRIHHDEDAEVYINGVLATKVTGFTTSYEVAEISPVALKAMKPGKNLVAIHCRQTQGGQYIDLGFVLEQPPGK